MAAVVARYDTVMPAMWDAMITMKVVLILKELQVHLALARKICLLA